jgi:hypothetical protein
MKRLKRALLYPGDYFAPVSRTGSVKRMGVNLIGRIWGWVVFRYAQLQILHRPSGYPDWLFGGLLRMTGFVCFTAQLTRMREAGFVMTISFLGYFGDSPGYQTLRDISV